VFAPPATNAHLKALIPLREIIRSFQTAWKDFSEDAPAICSRSQHSVQPEQGGFMAKQTRITIETDSLLIMRGRSSVRAWCSRCAAEVEMIALENMGVISNLERPELEEWLSSGELHRLQATDGSTLTCLNSLLARVQKATSQPGDSAAAKHIKETL
jgi:hypothetical protein